MAIEIERKFLVDKIKWRELSKPRGMHYRQGYILSNSEKSVRVRVAGGKSVVTIKGKSNGMSRSEFEYDIPREDALELLNNFCDNEINKTRYRIQYKNKVWEVDEFADENDGLIVAEIELSEPDELFDIPEWVAHEVTGDEKYYNARLAKNPYRNWRPA